MPVNTAYLQTTSGSTGDPGVTVVDRLSLGTFGVATQPAITFVSEQSLGFYRSAASTIAQTYGTQMVSTLSASDVLVGNGTAVAPSVAFTSDNSLGFYKSGNSSLAMSYGTLNLLTQKIRLSLATVANASGSIAGELLLVFQASGLSLIYSSGASIYSIASSALSAAAP